MKNEFKKVGKSVKSALVGSAITAISMSVVVPLLGLVAHGAKYLSDAQLENYSLKNRFETAYCFNVDESHKYYKIVYGGKKEKQYYFASPYLTYGLFALYSIGGGLIGGAISSSESMRREKEKNKAMLARNLKSNVK